MNKFWIKRFSRVLVPYVLAESIFFVAQGKDLGCTDIIMDFSLLKPLHPFGWYLHYILICYILFYTVWRVGRTDKERMILFITLFSAWFFIKSIVFIDEPFFLAARQMLAFPIGVFIGLKQDKHPECIKNRISVSLIVSSTIMYAFLHLPNVNSLPIVLYNFLALGTCTTCAFGIIGLTYSLKILQNKGVAMIASLSFEIYIIHGYFINILNNAENICGAGVVAFFLYTATGSVLLKVLTGFICRKPRRIG